MKISLSSAKELNAIYFGPVLSGYEFADIKKQGKITQILSAIRSYDGLKATKDFFRLTRGTTCEVYPFWPRAALGTQPAPHSDVGSVAPEAGKKTLRKSAFSYSGNRPYLDNFMPKASQYLKKIKKCRKILLNYLRCCLFSCIISIYSFVWGVIVWKMAAS